MEQKNAITQGVIWKQVLRYFWPLLFGTFFQQLYNTVDAVIVGRFVGKEALSAVGGTSSVLINVFLGFFIGLSSGATVTISQFYGAGNRENVSRAVHTAMAIAIAGGAFCTVAGIVFAPQMIRLLNTPDDVVGDSILYFRVYFSGMIANLVYNMASGILRAAGDSKRPLYFLIVSTVANIFLDLLFVVVFHMDVFGVSLATVICQLISAVMAVGSLMRTQDMYRLTLSKIRFHRDMTAKILQIGLPAAFQTIMYSVSNVVIQASINGFGTDAMAAWTAYGKLDAFFWMTTNSFGICTTTFVGQNYGAGKMKRVRQTVRQTLFLLFLASLVVIAVFMLFPEPMLSIFTTDANVIAVGVGMMRVIVPTYLTYISIEILASALRGMGDAFIPMILTCLGVCVLRVLWILIAVPIRHEISVVALSYPITWIVTSILFIIYYEYFVRKHKIA
jgi:putative MATE family efflux protein